MSDLYARLASAGFDRDFVQAVVLPEWWEDSLAAVPANRALAENLIARHLGLPLADLRQPDAALALPPLSHFKFKRYGNRVDPSVAPSISVAQRAAKILVEALPALPAFDPGLDPVSIRSTILAKRRFVDLPSLLEFCWEHGIVVLHLARTPKKSKRFDGLAMFCEGHPVLVLGSKRDSPAWLAFHLAHELAHVVLHHVTAGSPPLADTDLMASSSDAQEKEADRAACELLTGRPEPKVRDLKLTAVRLARHAEKQGPEIGVDPGVFALIYGRSNDRWPVAQNALKHLATDSGAQAMIAAALQTRLHPEDLPESSERFLLQERQEGRKLCSIRNLLAVGVLASLTGCATVALRHDPAGTYRSCDIACETLVLKPDHRFEYQLDGDMYGHEVTTGQWSQEGDLITLEGVNPCFPNMEESRSGRPEGIEIRTRWEGSRRVDDRIGATDGYASVMALPDEGGKVVVPIAKPNQILAEGYHLGSCSWQVKQPESDTFVVTLKPADGPPVVLETYRLTPSGIIKVTSWELKRIRK